MLTCSWETDPSGAITASSIHPTVLRESTCRIISRNPSLHFKICFLALSSSFSGRIFSRLWQKFSKR
jgi:hypothetical protein